MCEIRNKEVIKPPADVSFSGMVHVRPPRKFLLVRVHVPKSVNKAGLQQRLKLFAFFRREPRIANIAFRILNVQWRCGNIEVTTNDDGLLL